LLTKKEGRQMAIWAKDKKKKRAEAEAAKAAAFEQWVKKAVYEGTVRRQLEMVATTTRDVWHILDLINSHRTACTAALAAEKVEYISLAVRADFGLDGPQAAECLLALLWLKVNGELTPFNLHDAMCSGPKLTKLTQVEGQPHKVTFVTAYDDLASTP